MDRGLVTQPLKTRLVAELAIHEVPILQRAGPLFFHELRKQVHLRLLEAIPAPGVTHLHYEVVR